MSAVDDKERFRNLGDEDIEVYDSYIEEVCGGAARNLLRIRIEKIYSSSSKFNLLRESLSERTC